MSIKSFHSPIWIYRTVVILFCCCILALLLSKAKVDSWTFTDSKFSLLSGAVFLESGSFDLRDRLDSQAASGWQVYKDGEGIFYSYPVGTTLLHLPLIYLAQMFGWDLSDVRVESKLNRILAGISLILIFLIIFLLFSLESSFWPACVASLVMVLGTGLFSTVGLALWNLNYSILAGILILYFLQSEYWANKPDSGWIIGILLFTGFIVRPSFAVFVLVVFTYQIVYQRKQFLRSAIMAALLLIGYLLFLYSSFGRLTSGVYRIQAFNAFSDLLPNLIGHLVSPSRGFFIFSPFLIFVVIGLIGRRRKLKEYSLFPFIIALISIQFLYLSVWTMWWGGGGFGNRLATETLPGWIYLTFIALPNLYQIDITRLRHLICSAAFILCVIFSVFIHVVQGGFNPATVEWFVSPNKDKYTNYFWDWRFPQWLANENQIFQMMESHSKAVIGSLDGAILEMGMSNPFLELDGWGAIEGDLENSYRWTIGNQASITIPQVLLKESNLTNGKKIRISFHFSTFANQYINIRANGKNILNIVTDSYQSKSPFISEVFIIPNDNIKINFWIPEAKPPIEYLPDSNDTRRLGLLLRKIEFFEAY